MRNYTGIIVREYEVSVKLWHTVSFYRRYSSLLSPSSLLLSKSVVIAYELTYFRGTFGYYLTIYLEQLNRYFNSFVRLNIAD